MSRIKKDRSFPHGFGLSSDEQLAEIIAGALREDFGDTPSSIKTIGRLTMANLRAIKNWYSGKNAPSSRYLLILARSSPSILQFILMQVGGEDLWDVFELFHRNKPRITEEPKKKRGRPFGSKNVTTNVTTSGCEERRDWFQEQLTAGEKINAHHLADRWQIDLRTARRDIAGLVKAGAVVFKGARRNGWYELAPFRT